MTCYSLYLAFQRAYFDKNGISLANEVSKDVGAFQSLHEIICTSIFKTNVESTVLQRDFEHEPPTPLPSCKHMLLTQLYRGELPFADCFKEKYELIKHEIYPDITNLFLRTMREKYLKSEVHATHVPTMLSHLVMEYIRELAPKQGISFQILDKQQSIKAQTVEGISPHTKWLNGFMLRRRLVSMPFNYHLIFIHSINTQKRERAIWSLQ